MYLPLQEVQETQVWSLAPEKAMAPHSSTLALKIPWAEEPGRLQSMGWLRVGHNWATSLSLITFYFHALEKEMATHSSTLAWKIPWTEEPGRLQSMGSQRVRHDWATSHHHGYSICLEPKKHEKNSMSPTFTKPNSFSSYTKINEEFWNQVFKKIILWDKLRE